MQKKKRTQYTQLLLSHDVRISMESKGRALDTICDLPLVAHHSIRAEYLKDYASPRFMINKAILLRLPLGNMYIMIGKCRYWTPRKASSLHFHHHR